MAVSKSFKSTTLAIILALGVEGSLAQAAAKPVNSKSTLKVSYGSDVKSGAAQGYEVVTIGAEQALVVSSEKRKCVITQSSAKKINIPFQLLVEMVSTRRFELECVYSAANPSEQAAADSFYIRAFLE